MRIPLPDTILPRRTADVAPRAHEGDRAFRALHVLTAPLVLTTAIEATRQARTTASIPAAAAWAPLLAAPVAAAAHVVHAIHPNAGSRAALRLFDSAVLGAGAISIVGTLLGRRRRALEGTSLAAAAALGLAGVLGLIVDREQAKLEAEPASVHPRERVAARAPARRRPKIRRIVVHV